MTQGKTDKSPARQTSLRGRIMRIVVPVIMVTFLLIGVALALYLQAQTHTQQVNAQHSALNNASLLLDTMVENIAADVRGLAESRSAREFARDTQIVVSNAAIVETQGRLLRDMTSMLEQNIGTYLSSRYITYTGSIWSQSSNIDGTVPVTDGSVRLNVLNNDDLLQQTLNVPVGTVLGGEISFAESSAGETLPFFRFMSPVAAENDVTNLAGAVEVEVTVTPIVEIMQYLAANSSDAQGRRFILTDTQNRVLLDTASTQLDLFAIGQGQPVLLSDVSPQLGEMAAENSSLLSADTVGSQIASSVTVGLPGSSQPLFVLYLLDSANTLTESAPQAALVILFSLLVGGLLCILINLILGRVLDPVHELAQEVSRGVTPTTPAASGDEIGQLSLAFGALAQEAADLRNSLNVQSQRFRRNLDITSRIGRETATVYDIDQLLNRALNLISVEYNFYHAQVFLLDDIGKNAVLVYSTGEAGRELLSRQHKLEVGSPSVIGIVTSTSQPVLVNDTEHPGDIPWRFNPLLPATRAEMALPLQVGDQVIGALDVQSREANAFDEREVQTFQLLADQIAIAVQNARLLQQTEERVEQIGALNRRLTRVAWEETELREGAAYSYDLMNLSADENTASDSAAAAAAKPVEMPIVIRGEVIGTLEATGQDFSDNDQLLMSAVAERVAIALESARLFEETQNSLAETSTLYQLSRYLNEADNLDGVVQAIIQSVMPEASGGQILVFEQLEGDHPEHGVFSADWTAGDPERSVSLRGLRIHIPDHPILSEMRPNSVALVNELSRDARVDDFFRALAQDIGAQSMVLIPFSVRGIWRGIIMIEFPQTRAFSEREGRIYTALIDQAGITIDNRMLLTENEMALAQIERLYSASRSINLSNSLLDLINAARGAVDAQDYEMGLAILEGDLGENGWSKTLRLAAITRRGQARDVNETYDFEVSQDSPLLRRDVEIVLDHDEKQASGLVRLLRAQRQRFAAAFPLFSGSQPIALFLLFSAENVRLSDEDSEVFRALTSQMSTVLQNRRLLEQTASALDETRRLYDASRAISGASDAKGIYAAAAANLLSPINPATRISVLIAGPSPLEPARYYDCEYIWSRDKNAENDENRRIPEEMVSFVSVLKDHRDLLLVNDHRRDLKKYPALASLLERKGSLSAVMVPVRTRARWFGVILIENSAPNTFDLAYGRFVAAVADQMALALESQQLFAEAQDQAQRALALAEASQFASRIGEQELTDALTEVFQRIGQAADYSTWLLLLADPTRTRLNYVLEHIGGETRAESPGQYIDLNSSHLLAQTFRIGQPVAINDPRAMPEYAGMPDAWFETFGKRLHMPVMAAGEVIGVVVVGRAADKPDLGDSDIELVRTLAAQVAVAVENRRLFAEAQTERTTLFTILETLPAGVLVLDPNTFRPIQANRQAEQLLGRAVTGEEAFSPEAFNIRRSGTDDLYPEGELPIFQAARSGSQAMGDDVSVVREDGRSIDLLLNAAPIRDARGNVTAVVAAFEDITALRGLENSLQSSLRETITLYETTRAFTEAEESDDVLDQAVAQMATLEPEEILIVLSDEEYEGVRVVRSLSGYTGDYDLPEDLLSESELRLLGDIASDETFSMESRVSMLDRGYLAAASLPLISRSRRNLPLGWIILLFSTPQAFDERAAFLTTLADTAAVALDNRNLFRSTEVALQETASLYGATTAISRARNLGELGDALKLALNSLQPDLFAAYVRVGGKLVELFNQDIDGEITDLAPLIETHGLIGTPDAIFIDDLKAQEESGALEQDLMMLQGLRGVGFVPMRSDGVIMLGYQGAHRFDGGSIRFLNALADSAAVVVANITLLDQIQSTLQETSILYQASRALTDADTPADVLRISVDNLQNGAFTSGFIATLTGRSWNVVGASAHVEAAWQAAGAEDAGIFTQGVTLTPDTFPAWKLLASPAPLTIDDIQNANLSEEEAAALQTLGIQSVAVLPIRAAGRAIGVVVLSSPQTQHFTERDARIFRSFSEQASLRIDAARLLQQTERRARQLATNATVSQIASSILELDMLMPQLVEVIKTSFGYDHVQIFLMDDADKFAVLRASSGEAGRKLLEAGHRLEKGSRSVIGQVTAQGKPVIASDTADSRTVHRPNPLLPSIRSEMALPLILKGQVVGALDVQSAQSNAFDDDDIAVLTTLGAQIAVAIDNAQLFDESRQRANEMGFLFTVTTAAAAAENLDDALVNVAVELRSSLDALSVILYRPERYIDAEENTITILRPVALAGSDQPLSELSEFNLEADQNVIAESARSGQPVNLFELNDVRDYLPVSEGARSAIIVPLYAGTELIGIIVAEDEAPNAYDHSTLTLLLTLSGTLSAIVQSQQLLEQLQRTNAQLRELDRLKSDFLANMSHELRTPLNSIIGFSKVILKGIDGPLTEMQEQDLSTIYSSGVHLLNLINDILDQAKISAGKMDLQLDYFDMKNVVDAVRSIGIGLVKDKAINIVVDVAPGMPKVFGDEFRTRQVMLNLVSNAAKFTREGGITIRTYLVRDPETERYMVRTDVTDTGIGIAEQDLPLLFEAFRQVDSSLTRTVGGTGLGLPIARSLVEMMGGEILVESKLNVGSTFSIIMPTQPKDAEPQEIEDDDVPVLDITDTQKFKRGRDTQETSAVSENASADDTSRFPQSPRSRETLEASMLPPLMPPIMTVKRQILLIEDNPDMVDQFRRALQREGYEVFAASIPLEAEAMASGLHPTLIVLSAGFGDGAGWDILARLHTRDDTVDIPVVLVSLNDDEQRAKEAGAFAFVRRPFIPETLVKAVAEAERDSRTRRILIIDDNPESVRLLQELLLEQENYRIFTAANGMEGISLVARRRPDLVLLDLRMPEMDGFDVIRELRANPETANIPILVVTAESLTTDEQAALTSYSVIYKADLTNGHRHQLGDEVRSKLERV